MIIDLNAKMPMECPEFLTFVRSLPSAASGRLGCIAHHRIGHRYSQRKVSDFETMPLTDDEHKKLHGGGVHSFESEFGRSEKEMIYEVWKEAIRLGVLKVDRKVAASFSRGW